MQTQGYVEVFCKGKSYVDIGQMKNLSEDFYNKNFVKYYKHNYVFASEPFGSTVTNLKPNTNLKNVYKYKNLSNVKKIFTNLKNGAMMLIK